MKFLMMRAGLVVLLLLFTNRVVCAQQFNYTLRNYSAIDGLPQSQVNIILEDKNGYLWIGTHGGGLARYDGREFKVYTTLDGLLSNIVNYLKLDSQENLWIVHPRGITKFDGVSFKKFPQPDGKLKRVRRLFELNDTLFILSAPGYLGKIHQDSLYSWGKEIAADKLILYSHVLPNKDVMLFLSDSSVVIRSKKSTQTFSYKDQFSFVKGVFNFKDKVWVKTNIGFAFVDFEKKTFVSAVPPLKNNFVFYDSVREVFWTRYQNNLLREYKVKDKYKIDTVLKSKEISQVFVDSEMN
ncbi:MAG: hypothetical protein L0Y35_00080, partial [Flammeovirgaceae bacterium]|nr:hypothetical protein [Flammeovirgaceae bacterium]